MLHTLQDAAKKRGDFDPVATPIGKAMSEGITFCFDDQDVSEAAPPMEKQQIHRLPVLNRRKRIVGMLCSAISAGTRRRR